MRISDWSSDVCSSDLASGRRRRGGGQGADREDPGPARIDLGGERLVGPQPCRSRRRHGPAAHRAGRVAPPKVTLGESTPSSSQKSLRQAVRSAEHTSELQSLMRISYAVFCLKRKNILNIRTLYNN